MAVAAFSHAHACARPYGTNDDIFPACCYVANVSALRRLRRFVARNFLCARLDAAECDPHRLQVRFQGLEVPGLDAKELARAIIGGLPTAFPEFENLGVQSGDLFDDERQAQADASTRHPLQDHAGLARLADRPIAFRESVLDVSR